MRHVLAGIDRVRDGYAAIVARLVSVAALSLVLSAVVGGATYLLVKADAGRLPAGGGSGRVLRRGPAAGGRLGQPDRASVRSGRRDHRRAAGGRGRDQRDRLQPAQRPGAVEHRLHGSYAEAVRRPHGPPTHVGRLMAQVRQETAGMREAVVIAFNLPAIIGLSTTGGFEYQLEDLQGRTPEEFAATMRGLAVAANQQPELAQRLQHLHHRHAAGLPEDRPRKGADPRRASNRYLPGAANLARRLLRQRLQPVRADVAGHHPGRGSRPQRCGGYLSDQRAQRAGHHGAAARAGGGRAAARTRGRHPLQQFPRRHGEG